MSPGKAEYPEPLVVPPRLLPHKQTFIILHGRGSWAEKFGPPLLEAPIPVRPTSSSLHTASDMAAPQQQPQQQPRTLPSIFPHAKFVFPTAPRTRATIYGRALTHQWFNNWALDLPATDREELQVPGLRDTTTYLHGLIRQEMAAIPGGAGAASNVVLVGLSQGCAASLTSLLLWEGEPLGAVVGMCGWLPFRLRLSEQLDSGASAGEKANGEDEDGFDPFRREGEGDGLAEPTEPERAAVDWLREELDLPRQGDTVPAGLPFRQTPVFLGHGVQDDRVHVALGREAAALLERLEAKTVWREYETLGHWYSGEMLRDVVDFLVEATGWDKGDG